MKMGVETAENGTFRAALYCILTGAVLKLSDKRSPSYGEAFSESHKMLLADRA
jgi:hypothetical protein